MSRGEPQIVSTRLVADLETPVSAKLKLARNARYSFLLESVEGGAVRGRYSIIGLNPDLIWKVEGGKASINRKAGAIPQGPFEDTGLPPLAVAARPSRRKPHQAAGGCATHGGGRLRLHGLRHGAADGGAARRPTPTRWACPTPC